MGSLPGSKCHRSATSSGVRCRRMHRQGAGDRAGIRTVSVHARVLSETGCCVFVVHVQDACVLRLVGWRLVMVHTLATKSSLMSGVGEFNGAGV